MIEQTLVLGNESSVQDTAAQSLFEKGTLQGQKLSLVGGRAFKQDENQDDVVLQALASIQHAASKKNAH
ncbi:unnamed protein product [Rotaria socialis]|uniref:Uncharacterized protein n=1 Tax=Rotaria socialis TaxID=392032 RepID=A0A820Y456_9BILA|nr:unnamed protein product [Rotaria socialis]CAF3213495.1 unnamed protein product [Rotaria socialis]CAF3714872.1 unnamed protein product [Rotaria socialis]CAF4109054.1 unnamed protein product [Rotaria socialis]CAF4393375.1 unnamed protein product [Rotaria socialis]